jgi:hypothetical protein
MALSISTLYHYAEWYILLVVMLTVGMLSVVVPILRHLVGNLIKIEYLHCFSTRVTRLGKISQFGLLFKGPGNFWRGNMVCCKYFKSLEGVWWRPFRLSNWAWWIYFGLIWFSNCFGFYFQKLGDFFPVFWSPCSRQSSMINKIQQNQIHGLKPSGQNLGLAFNFRHWLEIAAPQQTP